MLPAVRCAAGDRLRGQSGRSAGGAGLCRQPGSAAQTGSAAGPARCPCGRFEPPAMGHSCWKPQPDAELRRQVSGRGGIPGGHFPCWRGETVRKRGRRRSRQGSKGTAGGHSHACSSQPYSVLGCVRYAAVRFAQKMLAQQVARAIAAFSEEDGEDADVQVPSVCCRAAGILIVLGDAVGDGRPVLEQRGHVYDAGVSRAGDRELEGSTVGRPPGDERGDVVRPSMPERNVLPGDALGASSSAAGRPESISSAKSFVACLSPDAGARALSAWLPDLLRELVSCCGHGRRYRACPPGGSC